MILLPWLLKGEEYRHLLITFKPVNQSTQKALFICVVYMYQKNLFDVMMIMIMTTIMIMMII